MQNNFNSQNSVFEEEYFFLLYSIFSNSQIYNILYLITNFHIKSVMESNSNTNTYSFPTHTKHAHKYSVPNGLNAKDQAKDTHPKTIQSNPPANVNTEMNNNLRSRQGINSQQFFNNSAPQSPLSPLANNVSLLRKQDENESHEQEQQNQNTLARLLMFQSGELSSRDHLHSNTVIGGQNYNTSVTGNQNNPYGFYPQKSSSLINGVKFSSSNSDHYETANIVGEVKYVNSQYITRNQYEQQSPDKNRQVNNSKNMNYNYDYGNFKKDKNAENDKFNFNKIPLYESEYQYENRNNNYEQVNSKYQKNGHTPVINEKVQEHESPGQHLELSRQSSKGNPQNNYVLNSQRQFGYSSESEASEDTFFTFIVKFVSIFTPKVAIIKRQAFQSLFLAFKLGHSSRNLYTNLAQYEGGYGNTKAFNASPHRYEKQAHQSNEIKNYGQNYYAQESIQKKAKAILYTDEIKAKKNNEMVFEFAVPKDKTPTTNSNPSSASNLQNGRNSWNQNHGINSISSIQNEENQLHNIADSYNLSTYNYNNVEINKRKHVFAIESKNQPIPHNEQIQMNKQHTYNNNELQRQAQQGKRPQEYLIPQQQQKRIQKNKGNNNYDMPTFKIIYEQQEQSNANTNSNLTPSGFFVQPRLEFNFNANVKVKPKAKRRNSGYSNTNAHNDQNQYNTANTNTTNANTNTNINATNNFREQANKYEQNNKKVITGPNTESPNTNANITPSINSVNSGNIISSKYDYYFDYATNQFVYADGTTQPPNKTIQISNFNNTKTLNTKTSQNSPLNIMNMNAKQLPPILIKMTNNSMGQTLKSKIEKPLLLQVMKAGNMNQDSTVSHVDSPSSRGFLSSTSIKKQKYKNNKLQPISSDNFIKQIINPSDNDQIVYMFNNQKNNNPHYADTSSQQQFSNHQEQCLEQYYPEPQQINANHSEQTNKQVLKIQSNSKQNSTEKNQSNINNVNNFKINSNNHIQEEQNISSSKIVYINVGQPLKFEKINLVNNHHTFPPPQITNQRPITSYVTNTHSVIFQNSNRNPGISPQNGKNTSPMRFQERPATYNPSPPPHSYKNQNSVPIIKGPISNKPVDIPIQRLPNNNQPNIQFANSNAPTPQGSFEIKRPNSPVSGTINLNTVKATSPPRILPQIKHPPQIKIVLQKKQLPPQNKKIYITYNDKNNSPNNSNLNGQPIIHIPRPMSQPNLRPISSFQNNKIQNSLEIAHTLQQQQNQKVYQVRSNYYASRLTNPQNIIINNKLVGQIPSPQPILRQCKSSPNLVKINYVTPVTFNNNIINGNNSQFSSQIRTGTQQSRPVSPPQTFIKLQSPKINMQIQNSQQISNNNNIRPASSIPTFTNSPMNNKKQTEQYLNSLGLKLYTNASKLNNTFINKLQGTQQKQQNPNAKLQQADNPNSNKNINDSSPNKKQRPQSSDLGSQSLFKASGKSVSVYNYVPPQTQYNMVIKQAPNQLPTNQIEHNKGAFSFNQANSQNTNTNSNSIHPIYRQYHDQQSSHRAGPHRKKLNVISKQHNLQTNVAYGLSMTNTNNPRSPTHKNI